MTPRKAPTFTYDPTWKPRTNRQIGRPNWDGPHVQARIQAALEAGQSLRMMAAAWGMNMHTLHHHLASRGVNAIPADRLGLCEVAETLNISEQAVHILCTRSGMQMGRWGGLRTLTTEQLAQLQLAPQRVWERPEGYVTTAELAAAWGISETSVRAKTAGLPRLSLLGDGPRAKDLFLLRDASTRAPRVGQATCPAGHWTGAELAAAIGVSPVVVAGWPSLGCPHIKGRKDRYYRPVAVAEWLRTRRKAHMREYGQLLELVLSAQVAA